jgi:hypothetical protein
MGFVGMGLWVVLVRERWLWSRERDGFMGLEREEEREERFGGEGGHGRRWEEKWRKLRFDYVW